jgi:N-acetylated-alpha-linked acidic dipeptidase
LIVAGMAGVAPSPGAGPSPGAPVVVGPPLGFSPRAWDEQQLIESKFSGFLDPARISRTHAALTAAPHRAGTPGSRRVAEYIAAEAGEAGFKAEIVQYEFYNSHPGPRRIEMTAPVRRSIPLEEDRIPGDRFTDDRKAHRAFCAYSGSGRAEGEVVYVGQGRGEDFRALDERGVALAGRIALMRYFGEGEGTKVLRAQDRGAVAVVLYADPAEDGFVHGEVYPKGNWRPPGSIMRRSVADPPYEGDALSPGWAAKPGARRLDPAAVAGLPRIPVLPISYREARGILGRMEGPEAPRSMQGGLAHAGDARPGTAGERRPGFTGMEPIVYRLGPGPARLRMEVAMDNRTDIIHNVLVRIPGAAEKDAWVIQGNHHDAWIYGAGDPSSGTAAQIETLRAFGRLQKIGWRPRRTIVAAFWDAEEMGLGGSTEWAEDHADELRHKGVAVINMDSSVFNGDRPLYVAASPCLHRLFRQTARAVPAPVGEGSLWDEWLRLQRATLVHGSVDAFGADFDPEARLVEPHIEPVPLGDDQTPFVAHLGIPGSDMYHGADYGMYHSLYEDRHWMETVVDPGFRLHRTMADFHGRLILRLANAPIVPVEPGETAAAWRRAVDDLIGRAKEKGIAARTFKPLVRALDRFSVAADGFAAARDAALARDDWPLFGGPAGLAGTNREVAAVDKALFAPAGLPDLPWYRSLWAGTTRDIPDLEDGRLPGLRRAVEKGSRDDLPDQIALYQESLDLATAHLRHARAAIGEITTSSSTSR